MARNTYVPAGLTNTRAYNWSRSAYISQNVPADSDYGDPGKRWQSVSAYEWMNYGEVVSPTDPSARTTSNPPFREWEAGRLPADLQAMTSGGIAVPARILRGYIRRAEYDAPTLRRWPGSTSCTTPSAITRDYVSYLDQGALDPFNTVYPVGQPGGPTVVHGLHLRVCSSTGRRRRPTPTTLACSWTTSTSTSSSATSCPCRPHQRHHAARQRRDDGQPTRHHRRVLPADHGAGPTAQRLG